MRIIPHSIAILLVATPAYVEGATASKVDVTAHDNSQAVIDEALELLEDKFQTEIKPKVVEFAHGVTPILPNDVELRFEELVYHCRLALPVSERERCDKRVQKRYAMLKGAAQGIVYGRLAYGTAEQLLATQEALQRWVEPAQLDFPELTEVYLEVSASLGDKFSKA